MATKLNKDVTRESSIVFDDREVQVTLTADQKIQLKLKGLRTPVSISIEDLFKQLSGYNNDKSKSGSISIKKTKKEEKENPTIDLFDLRSKSAINATLSSQEKAKFDQIIVTLIKETNK